MDSAYMSGRSGGIKIFFPKNIFFDPLYRPVAAKPFVLENFVLGMGTSVASALSAETIFEIMKCIADVDMPAPYTWSQKPKFSGFSILAKPTIEIFRIFDDGHSFEHETG